MEHIPRYAQEVNRILADIEAENNQGQKEQGRETQIPPSHPQDTMQDVYIVFIRENPDLDAPQVVDSVPTAEPDATQPPAQIQSEDVQKPLPGDKASERIAYGILSFSILMLLSIILLQLYFLMNPPVVTVTLIPKSKPITLTGTLQLGRVLTPITLSQEQTVPTTGKGHQDPKQATGTVTFYNGSNVAQTINAGTVLTGQDGVQVATDQTITVPAANLPQIGEATVSAHAINAGSAGNIPAYDITISLSNDLTVKNLISFMGGQAERNYQTVAKGDIESTTAPLKLTLNQSVNGALQGQLKSNEALVMPSCTTTTTADHRPGEEATTVKVTVSETCSAVAYNQDALQARVTDLLKSQAAKKLETGYSLLGNPQITITSATASKQVMLSFSSVSTWVYALSSAEQEHMKKLLAGKTKEKAMQLLLSLPGIESASLNWSGFGDDSRIPKDISHIHLALFYGL